MKNYDFVTRQALQHVTQLWHEADGEYDVFRERLSCYVNTNIAADEMQQVCTDLSREYSNAVDVGVLHRWGSRNDLASDLELFASSLATELLRAAVSRMTRAEPAQ